ncbi:MAG: hypothetical protein M1838_001283 [Thelocarpon superellum]|nr:MAG: hypothetical protein M1838_001283 [Thelocarpon superellum]
MAEAGRQSKRPFQPSITSFFAYRDDDTVGRDHPSRRPIASAHPSLPATVQSSLLNVGMRIRKSVPEGYKTPWSSTAFGVEAKEIASSRVAIAGRGFSTMQAELTPYCGILKVGSYAVQSTSQHPAFDLSPPCSDGDDPGWGGSSQDSMTSTVSTDSMPAAPPLICDGSHKRRLEDEDEDDLGQPLIYEDDDLDPVDFLTASNPPVAMPDLAFSRPLAHPRGRRRRQVISGGKGQQCEGQENAWRGGLHRVADFDEAEFLQPLGEVAEVEMGGV